MSPIAGGRRVPCFWCGNPTLFPPYLSIFATFFCEIRDVVSFKGAERLVTLKCSWVILPYFNAHAWKTRFNFNKILVPVSVLLLPPIDNPTIPFVLIGYIYYYQYRSTADRRCCTLSMAGNNHTMTNSAEFRPPTVHHHHHHHKRTDYGGVKSKDCKDTAQKTKKT